MNCRDVENSLPLYSGGELSRWRRFRVSRHLNRCDRCSTSLAELDSTRSVVREVLRAAWLPETSDSVWEDVLSRLPVVETSPVGARDPGAHRAGRARGWRFALVPAVAVAASLIVFVVISRNGGVPRPTVDIVTTATNAKLPPVVESIDGPGIKILDFATDNPGVTIAWVFQPASDDQDGQ